MTNFKLFYGQLLVNLLLFISGKTLIFLFNRMQIGVGKYSELHWMLGFAISTHNGNHGVSLLLIFKGLMLI